jgi:hypothetical protein
MPPGYVEFDATKWFDYCTNGCVKVRGRQCGCTPTKCLAQDIMRLNLDTLPVLSGLRLQAMFQLTIDVADRNNGHFALSNSSPLM